MKFRRCASALRVPFAVACSLALGGLAPAADAERLPDTVVPIHYTLALAPDLKAATFTGVETIDVTLKQPSTTITLNAADIEFQSVTITAAGRQQTATVASDAAKEESTFTVPVVLAAGPATIAIHYTGILNDKLRGFYLSKTAKRNYAVTQFEPTDARRAYPSFDEPAFKATYEVSLTIDAGDTAISNSAIASDTPGPVAGKHTLKFYPTPKMSTYLVAFLVGDFQCTSGSEDGVAIRVCSTPDKVELTHYGVDVARYVLHYYNTYFGIPYPLKKLDLIGLPDFEAGAMENFGAITYRETALLLDEKTASIAAKKEVALVIAHEMAHQWFGDLVTMQWWNNVWLNEGFATWMENKAVAALHPEWNIDQMVIGDLDGTLNLDAQPTTRAIRAKADSREEIEQMFDGISYGKASDVLLSVENYLGPEVFRQGVHNYLAAHLYSNATAEDFWGAQTATSHKPVDRIMDSLIAQPGVPILDFGTPDHGKVSVTQRRFFLSPGIQPDPAQRWTLPVCFKTGAESQQCELLTPATTELSIPAGSLFFANAAGKGYYRTAYAPANYKLILAQIETSLTPSERISFLGDEWGQVRANKSSVGDLFNLLEALKADPSSALLGTALGDIASIEARVAATSSEKAGIAAWIRRVYGPEYQKLGAPSPADTPNTLERRARLFGLLGDIGQDPAVLAQAHELAMKYLADPSSVDPTLSRVALAIAARHGNAELFDRLQKVYETSTNPEIQSGALNLLAEFEDPALATRALEYAISPKVRNQDVAIQIAIALGSGATRDLAWKFVQQHWDTIHALLTPELGNAVVGSTSGFCSAAAREDVKQFFTTHPVASADQTLRHAVERINGCIEFRALQEPKLVSWLATLPQ